MLDNLSERIGAVTGVLIALIISVFKIFGQFGSSNSEVRQNIDEKEKDLHKLYDNIIAAQESQASVLREEIETTRDYYNREILELKKEHKEEIAYLQQQITEMKLTIVEQTKAIKSLSQRNVDMAAILRDKDPDTISYRDRVMKTLDNVDNAIPVVHDIHFKVGELHAKGGETI